MGLTVVAGSGLNSQMKIETSVWAAVTAAALLSCGEPPARSRQPEPTVEEPRETVLDLLVGFDRARTWAEQPALDLRPKRAKLAFERGWQPARNVDGCAPCLVGFGERSELELFVAAPRDLTLRLTCRALGTPAEGRRSVAVAVAGTEVGRRALGAEPSTVELPIGGELLRRGLNRVVLEYGGDAVEPSVEGGQLIEPVRKMGCSAIEWAGLGPAKSPRVLADGRLRLPAGSGVDFHVDLPAGARLELGDVAADGVTLRAEIETAGGARRELPLPQITGSEPVSAIAVPLLESGIARISLVATGTGRKVDIGTAAITIAPRSEAPTAAPSSPREPARPNIIVFLVDTLRRDRLGAYGNPRGLTPSFDRFAAEAVLFERATAQAPWTVPTVASLFTGLEPTQHGANASGAVLVPQATTIAELLERAGYQRVAFVGSAAVGRHNGYDQGFERYEEFEAPPGCVGPGSNVVLDRLERWLAAPRDGRPLFLYVHTVDPHAPYTPPRRFRRFAQRGSSPGGITAAELVPARVEEARGLYDGEVAFADESFGRFVDLLRRHGLYDESLIVFVADHGEQFLEHRGWRHRTLHGEVLNIPLAIKLSASAHAAPARVAEPVYQVDLLPTLAELTGIAVPEHVHGRSLLPLLLSGQGRPAASRGPTFGYVDRWHMTFFSVFVAPYKLIWRWHKRHREVELYDVARDPAELQDLAGGQPVVREYLKQVILEQRAGAAPLFAQPADAPSAELTERLEALGYVQ